MKSSTGQHFVALDHIRALAAFLVFTWHFTHYNTGYPVSFDFVPGIFPLAILDEGHSGVALFMSLSGYLFAKIIAGRKIVFQQFIWNRMLRLCPLLIFVMALTGAARYFFLNKDITLFITSILNGFVLPTWPNGGWSIAVEMHFYLLLPFLLFLNRRSHFALPAFVTAAVIIRVGLWFYFGEVQSLAYWTIVGRIDQFALGIFAYESRSWIAGKHFLMAFLFVAFSGFYYWFDDMGGFYNYRSYPFPSITWSVIPTIEGLFYSFFIAWYDNSFKHADSFGSKFIASIGSYSYSIYLLHFYFVFSVARFINVHLMDITNFYVAVFCSLTVFLLCWPIGYLSFRFIESPFLAFRTKYTVD